MSPPYIFVFSTTLMFFIQVLQVDFLADFQFTQVYTGLLFLPPDVTIRIYDWIASMGK